MKKTLIIIDMQNDFIDGSLANPAAQAIVKPICDYLNKYGECYDRVIITQDTHRENYLDTTEGKYLPVKHCILNSHGWEVNSDILTAACKCGSKEFYTQSKVTFGNLEWYLNDGDEIVVVGTCTDICVVSNVLILKALYPNAKITVIANLCAGLTKEKHEAALEVMRSCQVEVI